MYSRSKVCLNIHHTQSVEGVNQRFFEIFGAGSLQLCDYKTFIGDNFTENDLLWYKNENELIEKINKAFNANSVEEQIRQNGYQKIIKSHTFLTRIKYILTLIKKIETEQ